MRWSHSERTTAWSSKTVETFRHDIDYMQEFEWRPYDGLFVPDDLHPHLEVCDIVAPLLLFECVEWHPADQVMRQFGYVHPPPGVPRDIPVDQHCIVLRGVQLHDWTVLHGPWIVEWANRRHSRLRDLHPLPTWDFLPTAEYRNWYMRSYGHLLRLTGHRPTVMVAITLRAATTLISLITATTLSSPSIATILSSPSIATTLSIMIPYLPFLPVMIGLTSPATDPEISYYSIGLRPPRADSSRSHVLHLLANQFLPRQYAPCVLTQHAPCVLPR
ncbi:uncharacterized protein DS421_3g71810 [Arachis hypogaea]|nr:uncharacterized protein DS421_3g71810 [Arachis hypogaea]